MYYVQDTALGREAERYTTAGKRFPDVQMMKVLGRLLDANQTGFLLDGFPRTRTQAELL